MNIISYVREGRKNVGATSQSVREKTRGGGGRLEKTGSTRQWPCRPCGDMKATL